MVAGLGRGFAPSDFVDAVARLHARDRTKTFEALYAELTAKLAAREPGSNTVARVDAGVHEIGKKIVEEAAEVWMAAEYQTKDQAAEEISQLLYHLQMMMLALDLGLDDVYRVASDGALRRFAPRGPRSWPPIRRRCTTGHPQRRHVVRA